MNEDRFLAKIADEGGVLAALIGGLHADDLDDDGSLKRW